jgi:PAS domain S-box-containing protein
MRRATLSYAGTVVAVAAVYVAAAKLGLSMAFVAEQVTAVWPPTGLALAAILLLGHRVWPGIAIGALVANATHNEPLLTACGIALGNTLEAVAGAWLLQRVVDFRNSLVRLKDVLGLVALAAGLSTAISATIGTASLCLGGVEPWARYASIWSVWWVGDAMGDLVVAPLLLVWASRPGLRWERPQAAEAVALAIALVAVSLAVFGHGVAQEGTRYSLEYVVFPLVIWAAIRFGPRGTTLATVVVSAIAIWSTVKGLGPFTRGTPHENLLFFQTFMGAAAMTGLALAAVVSERKVAEDSLRESEARLKFTLEAAGVGTWDWNMLTGALLWSDNLERIHGLLPGTFKGTLEGLLEDVHSDDRPAVLQAIARASVPGTDFQVEYRQMRKDGSLGWMGGKGTAVFDSIGRPLRMTGVCMDITDRKKAESALRASDTLKQAMLDAALDCIITMDHNGRVVEWNPAAEKTFGYSRAEALGKRLADLAVPPDLRERHRHGLRHFLATGEGPVLNTRIELPALRADGTIFPAEIAIAPIRSEGWPLFTGYVRDITERKRAELEIRMLNAFLEERVAERTKELEQVNAELEAFTYSVSHELRAPLRTMEGFGQALLEDCAASLDPSGKEYVRRIIAGAERMNRLIDDLLAYSRVVRADVALTDVALEPVMADALEQLHAEILAKGAQVNVITPLPSVRAHKPTLVQVLANLVSNAVKFVAPGTPPHVQVWAEGNGEWVRVWVRDNGIGIDPKYHSRIFRVFERLHGVERYAGTGIGLAIALTGAERMGGRLGVESDAGQGSHFWIELRRADSH